MREFEGAGLCVCQAWDGPSALALAIIAVVLINSEYGAWYPWTLAPVMLLDVKDGVLPVTALIEGSVGGIVISVLGGWHVTSRDVL